MKSWPKSSKHKVHTQELMQLGWRTVPCLPSELAVLTYVCALGYYVCCTIVCIVPTGSFLQWLISPSIWQVLMDLSGWYTHCLGYDSIIIRMNGITSNCKTFLLAPLLLQPASSLHSDYIIPEHCDVQSSPHVMWVEASSLI